MDFDLLRHRISDIKYKDWSLNDMMYIPQNCNRESYRQDHNIQNPFEIIDKEKYNSMIDEIDEERSNH